MAKKIPTRLDVSWQRSNTTALLAACLLAAGLLAGMILPGRFWLATPPRVDYARVSEVRQKIDPNVDPPASLRRLHQVGPARAKAIYDYAQSHGPRAFDTAEDVKKVKGIGDGILNRFRDQLALPSASPSAE